MTVAADIPPAWTERPSRDRKSVRLATNTRPDRPIQVRPSSPEARRWISAIIQSIEDIMELRRGWNGRGSNAVNHKNLEKLLRVLHDVGAYEAPNPQLVPLSSGGVQAEWHYAKQSIEIGVSGDGEIFAFATDDAGECLLELEDTWVIPRADLLALRRAILTYAGLVRDRV